jgi:hypothetical protein
VKAVAAHLSHERSVIGSHLTEFLGGFPDLMAGDLSAKCPDLNSWLTTARVSLLRDHDNRNSCLICGPDTPVMVPYQPSAIHDDLDIVVVRDFVQTA